MMDGTKRWHSFYNLHLIYKADLYLVTTHMRPEAAQPPRCDEVRAKVPSTRGSAHTSASLNLQPTKSAFDIDDFPLI